MSKSMQTSQRSKKFGSKQKVQVLLQNKTNSKAFAIPILTVIDQCSLNKDSICFRIYFLSLITLKPFICFDSKLKIHCQSYDP